MSNEVDTLSNNDIQPYDEGMPVLSPMSPSPDTWGRTDVLTNREIDEYHPAHSAAGPTLFGSPLPAGATAAQAEAMLGQLGGAFMHDLSSLGYSQTHINAAIQFMTANALKKPYTVQKNHNFNLHGQDDWLGNAFGNMVQTLSGSPRAKQQFVTACLQWLAKVTAKFNKPEGSGDMPRMAPTNSDPTANLTDQQYQQLVDHNNRVQAQTMATLQQKWGTYTFKQNIEIAQKYMESLPSNERAHFDRFTGNFPWTHMLNTVECLTFLFDAATGAHSIPKDGAGIARELASIENVMRTERAKYLKDPQLQARYRTLLDMKG